MSVVEDRLEVLARALHLPATVDVDAIVQRRARTPSRTRVRRSWAVRAVAAVAVVAAVITVVPSGRSTVARWLGLSSTRIEPVDPSTPTATFPPSSSSGSPVPDQFGLLVRDAEAEAGVTAFVPALLGAPMSVEVVHPPDSGQVVLTYAPSDLLPASPVAGIGALVSTLPAHLEGTLFVKMTDAGTDVREVTVNGVSGFWLSGAPHTYAMIDRNGDVIADTLRLATNTLLWEQDGVTYRIEASVDLDVALSIAEGGSLGS